MAVVVVLLYKVNRVKDAGHMYVLALSTVAAHTKKNNLVTTL